MPRFVSRTAISWGWLWLMLGLLGLLAFLQWRWTGEVSRAERERLERGLALAARGFENDFDREISRLSSWFQGRDSDLGLAVASWREESPFPDILRDVLVFEPTGDGPRLLRYDEERSDLVEMEWTQATEPLRRLATSQLASRWRRGRAPVAGIGPPIEGAPTLLVPGRPILVLRLDRKSLAESLLPDLIATHFPPDGLGHELVVVDSGDPRFGMERSLVLATGQSGKDPTERVPNLDTLRAEPPIAMLFRSRAFDPERSPRGRFPIRFRPETRSGPLRGQLTPGESAGVSEPGQPGPGAETSAGPIPGDEPADSLEDGRLFDRSRVRDLREPLGAWLVFAQHRQGSLDRAVARLRARNLTISLGILIVLGGAGAFLLLSARRAHALARQQLDFVAGLTHELHTPLAAIESASANLADGVVAEPIRVREYGALIGREGRRLTRMVGQALELAGVRSGRRPLDSQPIDVARLLEQSVSDHRHAIASAGVTVEVDLESELETARGDVDSVRRVIDNLLSNALKYGGSRIVLSARHDRGPAGKGKTELRGTGPEIRDWITIEVADNGPGIDETDRTRLFEPFFRGARAREGSNPGSGLGLHLARELVTRMGGRISVEERDGGGALFRVFLPRFLTP